MLVANSGCFSTVDSSRGAYKRTPPRGRKPLEGTRTQKTSHNVNENEKRDDHDDTQYVHTLNSTLIATTRVLVAIMENFQTKDGHIRIPEVLQGYMGNQKEI